MPQCHLHFVRSMVTACTLQLCQTHGRSSSLQHMSRLLNDSKQSEAAKNKQQQSLRHCCNVCLTTQAIVVVVV